MASTHLRRTSLTDTSECSVGYQRSEEPTERRKVSQARPSPRQSSKAAPAQATEDEGRRASPPAGSNGNTSSNSQEFDRPRQRPANAPKQEPGSIAARDEGHALGLANKDNAKEWLDKGGKWLLGAGKKLAAAAKEAQSTIQTKLEDMEVFKSSQGASRALLSLSLQMSVPPLKRCKPKNGKSRPSTPSTISLGQVFWASVRPSLALCTGVTICIF